MKREDVGLAAGAEKEAMNDYKGYISTEHTLWCGGCAEWVSASSATKAEMARYGRKRGWKKTKENGWLCHRCAKKPETL